MEQAVPTERVPGDAGPRRLQPPTPRVAVTILAAIALGLVVLSAAGAAKPFLLGALLVYLLGPLVERLARFGVPRFLAVLLVFALAIAVVAGVGTLALTPLIQQLRLFVEDLPTILAGLRSSLLQAYTDLSLPAEARDFIDGLLDGAGAGIGGLDIGVIISPLVNSLMSVVSTITAYAILPAWLFFVLKDRVRLADSLERSLPVMWRGDVFAILAISNRVFGNWIRGQIFLGAVVGVASYVGLMVLSVLVDPVFARYAVLLAIIAGVFELVPFIGPILAAIPAVLIGLTIGPQGFLAAFLLYLGIQQLENNVLVPKIQGDAVELHPSAVMFALVIGASLGGIIGAIISLPIAAAARDIYRYLFNRTSDPPATVDEALARLSPKLPLAVRRSAMDFAPALAAPAAEPADRAGDALDAAGARPRTPDSTGTAGDAPSGGARQ
jgi:predicted PurR-regulated permease PerM